MSTATVTQLPGSEYPWAWALRIQSADSDRFHAFIDDLKREIFPRNRKWDGDGKRWLLKDDEVDTVLWLLAKHSFTYDFEERKKEPEHRQLPMSVADAAKTLYLLPTAPTYVVQAAYRALAKQVHPDAGGSNEQMQKPNVAMEILRATAGEGGAPGVASVALVATS